MSKPIRELEATGERLLTDDYDRFTLEHLHRYALALAICKDKHVLDIASGEGYGANLLAGVSSTVIGVEISEDAVAHSQSKYQRPNLKFLQGAADNIPLPSGSVHTVVSFETIEHHDKHEEMMAEIKRVLRSGGVLIMSSPDKLNFSTELNYSNPFHVKELYLEEFRSLIKRYFDHVEILLQRVQYGSLVVPEKGGFGFTEYRGAYSEIKSSSSLQKPLYNLCIASDGPLPDMGVSLFEGNQVLDDYIEQQKNVIMNSNSFKIGRYITWPFRKLLRR